MQHVDACISKNDASVTQAQLEQRFCNRHRLTALLCIYQICF